MQIGMHISADGRLSQMGSIPLSAWQRLSQCVYPIPTQALLGSHCPTQVLSRKWIPAKFKHDALPNIVAPSQRDIAFVDKQFGTFYLSKMATVATVGASVGHFSRLLYVTVEGDNGSECPVGSNALKQPRKLSRWNVSQ